MPLNASHLRTALIYVALVGLPVAGLVAVLQAGKRLEAPPALRGTWRVEEGAACGVRQGDTFEVVQSGQFVVVSLDGRPPMDGRLRDGVLRARGGARSASTPGCGQGQLELALRPGAGARLLEGTGGIVGCSACPPRPFVAVRADGGASPR